MKPILIALLLLCGTAWGQDSVFSKWDGTWSWKQCDTTTIYPYPKVVTLDSLLFWWHDYKAECRADSTGLDGFMDYLTRRMK